MWVWQHVLSEEPARAWFELKETLFFSDSPAHTELTAVGVTASLFGELMGGEEQ